LSPSQPERAIALALVLVLAVAIAVAVAFCPRLFKSGSIGLLPNLAYLYLNNNPLEKIANHIFKLPGNQSTTWIRSLDHWITGSQDYRITGSLDMG
jgi:hypothetical protein